MPLTGPGLNAGVAAAETHGGMGRRQVGLKDGQGALRQGLGRRIAALASQKHGFCMDFRSLRFMTTSRLIRSTFFNPDRWGCPTICNDSTLHGDGMSTDS